MTLHIDKKSYENSLFIHIPKTAGSSIFMALKNSKVFDWTDKDLKKHYAYRDANFLLGFIPEDIFKFTVVRNPFTRAYSYYKHFNKINNTNFKFKDFLNIVDHKKNYNKTPLIAFTQSYFIFDNGINQMNKTYRFENLKELENDFKISLPHWNVGEYNIKDSMLEFNDEIINKIIDIYEEDFINFGYSTEFRR